MPPVRKVALWLFGPPDEDRWAKRLRAVPVVLLVAPAVVWIRDDRAPEVELWLQWYAVALVALVALNWRLRPRERNGEHRVVITEHHPPPGDDRLPYATATCSCGWTEAGDRSLGVTRYLAEKHSNSGPPRVLRR
jgi:hypothetical protein